LAATCGATTFQPQSPFLPPGTTHNAYYVQDPAGEQRAVFDLEWGGVLASLKQNGAERVWGNAVGGMVQPAWHAYPVSPTTAYNPTAAGANPLKGSVVLGVRCVDSNTLNILSGVLDYNNGNGGYVVFNAVKNGVVVANTYATPYVINTLASFVSNTVGGPPSYYLKLEQSISNTDKAENFLWGFELAGYVPYTFIYSVRYPSNCTVLDSNCYSSSTRYLLGGWYPNSNLTAGTAFFVSPQIYWAANTRNFVGLNTDNTNQNHSVHMFNAYWTDGPGLSRRFVWYVLVGNWSKALSFAQTF
jgi:hypothetical protein